MNTDHPDKRGIVNKMKTCAYPCRLTVHRFRVQSSGLRTKNKDPKLS